MLPFFTLQTNNMTKNISLKIKFFKTARSNLLHITLYTLLYLPGSLLYLPKSTLLYLPKTYFKKYASLLL